MHGTGTFTNGRGGGRSRGSSYEAGQATNEEGARPTPGGDRERQSLSLPPPGHGQGQAPAAAAMARPPVTTGPSPITSTAGRQLSASYGRQSPGPHDISPAPAPPGLVSSTGKLSTAERASQSRSREMLVSPTKTWTLERPPSVLCKYKLVRDERTANWNIKAVCYDSEGKRSTLVGTNQPDPSKKVMGVKVRSTNEALLADYTYTDIYRKHWTTLVIFTVLLCVFGTPLTLLYTGPLWICLYKAKSLAEQGEATQAVEMFDRTRSWCIFGLGVFVLVAASLYIFIAVIIILVETV